MQYKEYPDCRICILDYKFCALKALKSAQTFCQKSKIPFCLQSRDVKKLLYHFAISEFCNSYTSFKTTFTKIYGVYKVNIDKEYEKILQKVLRVVPVPFCLVENLEHPDAKYSAIRELNKDKSKYQQLKKFAYKNDLIKIQEQIKKQNIFFSGTVDLSRVLE